MCTTGYGVEAVVRVGNLVRVGDGRVGDLAIDVLLLGSPVVEALAHVEAVKPEDDQADEDPGQYPRSDEEVRVEQTLLERVPDDGHGGGDGDDQEVATDGDLAGLVAVPVERPVQRLPAGVAQDDQHGDRQDGAGLLTVVADELRQQHDGEGGSQDAQGEAQPDSDLTEGELLPVREELDVGS